MDQPAAGDPLLHLGQRALRRLHPGAGQGEALLPVRGLLRPPQPLRQPPRRQRGAAPGGIPPASDGPGGGAGGLPAGGPGGDSPPPVPEPPQPLHPAGGGAAAPGVLRRGVLSGPAAGEDHRCTAGGGDL